MQGTIYYREALGTPRRFAKLAFLLLLLEYYEELLFDEHPQWVNSPIHTLQ